MRHPTIRVVAAGDLPHSFPTGAFEGRINLVVAHTDDDLRSAVAEAEVLYSWHVPAGVPENTPILRWVQLPSAGADHLRGLPVWKSDVVITASQGIHTVPMSEHLFALLLALTRQVPMIVRAQDKREWVHDWRGAHLRVGELRGRTMGILGWGRVGDGVAHLARSFGMRVIGTRWSIHVPRGTGSGTSEAYADPPWLDMTDNEPDVVFPSAQLHDVLAQSDCVVCILPLTDETRGMLGVAEFAAMKRGALFLNIGRGAVVDEDALMAALRSGQLAGAALDVFENEPLGRSSPLWSLTNVIVSPHVGGVSEHTWERAARFFAVNLSRYLDGEPLYNLVNRNQGY